MHILLFEVPEFPPSALLTAIDNLRFECSWIASSHEAGHFGVPKIEFAFENHHLCREERNVAVVRESTIPWIGIWKDIMGQFNHKSSWLMITLKWMEKETCDGDDFSDVWNVFDLRPQQTRT